MKKFMIVAAAVALSVAPVAAFADGGDWMPWQSHQGQVLPPPPQEQTQPQANAGTSHMYVTAQLQTPSRQFNPDFGSSGSG